MVLSVRDPKRRSRGLRMRDIIIKLMRLVKSHLKPVPAHTQKLRPFRRTSHSDHEANDQRPVF